LRIKLGNGFIVIDNGLILVNICSLLALVSVLVIPSGAARVILTIPFALFAPGYALASALFVGKGDLNNITRVALSFGLSIVVLPLIGFALNATVWGIRPLPVCLSIGAFVFLTSIVAWFRMSRLLDKEEFATEVQTKIPLWSSGKLDAAMTLLAAGAVAASLVLAAYVFTQPRSGESFTQFKIVAGAASEDYPRSIKVGEEAKVIVSIVNREAEQISYTVAVKSEGTTSAGIGPVLLRQGEEWQSEVPFSLHTAGKNQKVEFCLYRDNEPEPYLAPLYLWVNVN
jgi:uncharacterized membrane protein